MQNLTLSITQLNNYIKNIFDNEELLLGISVYGEVTNFKISSGIAYFDIKEDGAQLSCVKFSSPVPFAKNGDKVIVTGRLNYHVRLGRLSFVVQKVEAYGMGELYQKYLELKARLEKEGVFDASRKKPIPQFATTIGVVTSETGAVIRDIYHVTRAKNPKTNILVYPSRVQGDGAEREIAAGIEYFNKAKNVDVIILARGGGSFEDLAPFNTELVARAIFDSDLPVISAVGHETDFSISDFASDLRAPTPSVAAELAVFNYYETIEWLDDMKLKMSASMDRRILTERQRVVNLCQLLAKDISQQAAANRARLGQLASQIAAAVRLRLSNAQNALRVLTAKIEKSNPLSILKLGYGRVLKGGKSASIKDIKCGDSVSVVLDGGEFESKVTRVKENHLS